MMGLVALQSSEEGVWSLGKTIGWSSQPSAFWTPSTFSGSWYVPFSTLFFDNSYHVYWQAKGEAEAELAAMCSAGAVDAVMTDDSDVFAFGCQRVIRK
jgi:hypothetical protein